MKLTIKKIIALVAASAVFITAGYALAQGGFITNYFADKDHIRFLYDARDQYLVGGSVPVSLQLFDVNTGQKPAGVTMTLAVNGVSRGTVIPASSTSREFEVDLRSMNLPLGDHTLTFTSPNACGNFFDYSVFGPDTKFDNVENCVFEKTITITDGRIMGCLDPLANNFITTATVDDGSCTFDIDPADVLGCADLIALNYNPAATADDGSCTYDPSIVRSTFQCSQNRTNWVECEGRTFVLQKESDPIYVKTDPQHAGVWSDWCTGDVDNGVQANFTELISNGSEARVNFQFTNPGELFDMVLCLNPDSDTSANSSKNIKIRIFDIEFLES